MIYVPVCLPVLYFVYVANRRSVDNFPNASKSISMYIYLRDRYNSDTETQFISYTKCAKCYLFILNFFFRTLAFHKWNAFEHGNNAGASVFLLKHLTPYEFNFCNTFNLHRFRVYQFYKKMCLVQPFKK